MINLVSWNVNGLRACLKKDFLKSFHSLNPDAFAIQETKMKPHQALLDLFGYNQFWNSAKRKGYSGTVTFSRLQPIVNVAYGIGLDLYDDEGRVVTIEYDKFFFVNVYSPNSRQNLERLDFRLHWEDSFRNFVSALDSFKPVIIAGDLNVAHNDIDLKNPTSNHNSNGFTDQERLKFSQLLNCGFVDSFRLLYPNAIGAYSWWSYIRQARVRNSGWRIDYFLVSNRIAHLIVDSKILQHIEGSDHCPVQLLINL